MATLSFLPASSPLSNILKSLAGKSQSTSPQFATSGSRNADKSMASWENPVHGIQCARYAANQF